MLLVYELIFVPLWNAGTSRWLSGCFCWRTSLNKSLSIEAELQFVVAFGNSIMAEVSLVNDLTYRYIDRPVDEYNRSRGCLQYMRADKRATLLAAFLMNLDPRFMAF